MQTLWSRVAQVRRACNCPSCLPNTNAIARRATTATSLRTPRVGDIFTVSISSLTAGIAFADSKKKDERRNAWDKVIGEVRATVDATEIQQQSRLAALSDDARLEPSDSTRVIGHSVSAEGVMKGVKTWDVPGSEEQNKVTRAPDHRNDTWLDVFDWAQDQQRLREASGFQDWKGLPLSLLQRLSKEELSELLANDWLFLRFYGGPDCDRLVNGQYRRPVSLKKLRTLEWSVACMVLRLLVRCSNNPWETWEDSTCPCKSLLRELYEDRGAIPRNISYIRERLSTLHADKMSKSYYEEFESPQAPNYHETAIEDYKQTTEMNESLQRLLKLMNPKTDLSDLMSKLCYNLLATRTPPNIDTYNMLLTRFCILGRNDLVWVVRTSLLESHVRPNEITHITLLRHFTALGKRRLFWQYLERMEGRYKGLALAWPVQNIHPMLRERYLSTGTNERKAFEKARMNGQVYESLIVGLLRYNDRQAAMHYYRRMISDGWENRIGIWTALLQDCCHRLDWTVGTAVMEKLEKSNKELNTLVFEWLLRLCQCCAQQEFFGQILRNGVRCGALPASMLDLPDSAKTKDVAFLIEYAKGLQSRKAIKSLEKAAKTDRNVLPFSSPFLLTNILYNCHDEDTLSYTIDQMVKRWKARFALQSRLDIISEDISHTVVRANKVLYASDADHFSSVMFWLSRRVKKFEREFTQSLRKVALPRLPTVRAAAAFSSYRNPVTNNEAERSQLRIAEDGQGDRGNSADSSATASFPGSEVEGVSHSPPRDRQPGLVQGSPPTVPMDPPNHSVWKDLEKRLIATA